MSMPVQHMTATPMLSDLLQGIAAAPDIPVLGIASDSRQLRDGYLFLAVQGLTTHGLDFLEQARQAGASAVAWDASTGTAPENAGLRLIAVHGLAQQVGEIADRFYGHPSERLDVIGVTGTNGKTTVAWMIAQAGELLGETCGYIGTLGHGVGEVEAANGMTTPPVVDLHRQLAEFVDQDAVSAAVEVSSHALSQGRVDGVRFDTAVFTNLSRDHLDYHTDMAEYFDSKARLFLECSPRHRIINVDSHYGLRLASLCGPDVVTVATKFDRAPSGHPFLSVRSVVASSDGSDVRFVSSWGGGRFMLHLPGDFNVANAATVLALLLMKGVAVEQACDLMSQLQAPPGRMQRVAKEGPAVFIDYAHTPTALDGALQALRAHCAGKLWCVFGCGGDRDRGKRPQMGKAAERQGDQIVLTTDNARSEDPAHIVDDILRGMDHPEHVTVIEDRSAAIGWTIGRAADDDVVLIAGKGHETYQEAGGRRISISDFGIASRALAARGGAG
jgi:UDP-N-acetylmuramoyl-L-alanyl-D-glutamate--2,6-diaminopimelate ligase